MGESGRARRAEDRIGRRLWGAAPSWYARRRKSGSPNPGSNHERQCKSAERRPPQRRAADGMAGGRAHPRSVLDLSVAGNLRARAAAGCSKARCGTISAWRPRWRKPGDYRTTFIGSMPVMVARDFDDEIYAFENRCAHRGALIVLDQGGHARDFTCVYHAWNYDLKGNLKAVAFEDGVDGKGGMAKTFCRSDHGPRKLRIATFCGLVFGSAVRRRAADRGISRRGGRGTHQARAAQAGGGDRPLHADAAEQLEALFRERQGHLSRQPAAHVLHHLPHQPAVAARRHGGQPGRRQPRELLVHRQPEAPSTTTRRWGCAPRTRASR